MESAGRLAICRSLTWSVMAPTGRPEPQNAEIANFQLVGFLLSIGLPCSSNYTVLCLQTTEP